MDPRPDGGSRRAHRFIRIEDSPRPSVSEAGHTVAA
jgi:hypothetical protein